MSNTTVIRALATVPLLVFFTCANFVAWACSGARFQSGKRKSFFQGTSKSITPICLKYDPLLNLQPFVKNSEPIVLTDLPPSILSEFTAQHRSYEALMDGSTLIDFKTLPKYETLSKFIWKSMRKIIMFAITFRGRDFSGYAHMDTFPSYNFYFIAKGSKDVILIPKDGASFFDCETGFDSIFLEGTSGANLEWVNQAPQHYRFTLHENQVLVFNNSKLLHKFMTTSDTECVAHSLRLTNIDVNPLVARKFIFNWPQAWDAAGLFCNGGRTDLPTGLFINNKFVPSVSGKTFETIDPNTGNPICSVSEAQKEDVDIAVAAASAAFENSWSKVSPTERGRLLYKLADLVERDLESLAALEALDNGKPFTQAIDADLKLMHEHLRYFAGWADKIDGRLVDMGSSFHGYTKAEPIGVVGQIIPWNFPLLMMTWKISPALAAGNCLVLKTSEKTPLSALRFAELVVEAGFPPGVVNILSGFGPVAGDAIARHPDIRKVAFTGSTATGKKIMVAAAESNLKKVTLELGGKSPNLIFNDAKLDQAVDSCITGFTFNQGQVCCAGTRVFVQEGVYDSFLSKLTAKVATRKVGPSFKEDTDIGPLVDKIQFDKVMGYLEIGKAEGAQLVYGGERIGQEGFYIMPTIFGNVKEDMRIVREEIFGPVICVQKFKTVDEVIKLANDTEYGLAASVHTESLNTAIKVANAIHAGTVWVNGHNNFNAAMPFGGHKESGFGSDGGPEAILAYTKTKSVFVSM
ncbi:aldehyde dehydrogenase (NAD(P)(+)) ald5 [Entophlyctis sp. JEL0112]|nr:aldehyde dehydrogenase (NAD(P)(+)) ald5 [Entophlyctis sp. JEL0112]